MKITCLPLCALSIIFSLNIISSANAAVLTFSDRGIDFEINDDDPFAATISFSDTTIQTPTLSTSSLSTAILTSTTTIEQPFPDPPLVVRDFDQLTVSITSFSIVGDFVVTGGQALPLTMAGTDTFEFESGFTENINSIIVSGVWSVEGDTETVSGTFGTEFQARLASAPTAINTSQYPDYVFLNSGLAFIGSSVVNVGSSIDGGSFGFAIGIEYRDNEIFLSSIPVPPALYLFASGLIGFFGLARRARAQRVLPN